MRDDGMVDVHAEVIAASEARVVVRLGWIDPVRSRPVEMFQVLRLRDGKVADMQDHDRRREALTSG